MNRIFTCGTYCISDIDFLYENMAKSAPKKQEDMLNLVRFLNVIE